MDTIYRLFSVIIRRQQQNSFKVDLLQDAINKEQQDVQDIVEMRNIFKASTEMAVKELPDSEELNEIINGFLANVPANYFFIPELIAGIENLIEQKNDIGRLLFLTNEELRRAMVKRQSLKNNAEVKAYIEDYFEPLVQIISNIVDFEDELYAIYTVYRVVSIRAINHFSNLWKEQYGNCFSNIASLQLNEATEIYCGIESINPKNLLTAGSFVYFLMKNRKLRLSIKK